MDLCLFVYEDPIFNPALYTSYAHLCTQLPSTKDQKNAQSAGQAAGQLHPTDPTLKQRDLKFEFRS